MSRAVKSRFAHLRPGALKMFRCQRRRSGFTFLEIMLVVVIIGILAATVMPRLVGKTGQAKVNATQASMESVKTALHAYEMDNDGFPSTSEGLAALITRPSSVSEEQYAEGGYISDKKLPRDAWGREFQYAHPSEHGMDFDLVSAGKDGQFGTEDDISNYKGAEESR